jgi:hypothetical protein
MKYIVFLLSIVGLAAFSNPIPVPPLAKGTFSGTVDLSNSWGNYYNAYTQTGVINIVVTPATLGGRAYVKITANGTNVVNFSGFTVIRGVTNNAAWAAGNYECYFECNGTSEYTANILKY